MVDRNREVETPAERDTYRRGLDPRTVRREHTLEREAEKREKS